MTEFGIRRRATPELTDTLDDRSAQRYEELYADIEDEMRAEHDREFGTGVKFKADGAKVHARVVAMMVLG